VASSGYLFTVLLPISIPVPEILEGCILPKIDEKAKSKGQRNICFLFSGEILVQGRAPEIRFESEIPVVFRSSALGMMIPENGKFFGART